MSCSRARRGCWRRRAARGGGCSGAGSRTRRSRSIRPSGSARHEHGARFLSCRHSRPRPMPFVAATRSLGRAGLFSLSVLRASKPTADFFAELIREIYKIGARSLPIIAVGGAFVGLSVTLLGYRALETYGAANQI